MYVAQGKEGGGGGVWLPKSLFYFLFLQDLRADSIVREWNSGLCMKTLRAGGRILHTVTRQPRWDPASVGKWKNRKRKSRKKCQKKVWRLLHTVTRQPRWDPASVVKWKENRNRKSCKKCKKKCWDFSILWQGNAGGSLYQRKTFQDTRVSFQDSRV